MVKQCKLYIKLFERVPDFTCQLLVKILCMLYVCLTGFEDAKLIDQQFWKFMMGTRELAWEFEVGQLRNKYTDYGPGSEHYQATTSKRSKRWYNMASLKDG